MTPSPDSENKAPDKEEGLKIRWVPDHKSPIQLVTRFDPITGEKFLLNPETGKRQSRPLLGVIWSSTTNGPSPQRTGVSTRIVTRGIREGWITVLEARRQIKPAGPPSDPYKKRHNFLQGDVLVVECLDEILHYEITRPPSQWIDPLTGNVQTTWDYKLKLIQRIAKNVIPS